MQTTSNCTERCPDGEADGGERSSSNIVDDVGDKDGRNDDAASPRSGRRSEQSGDAGDSNADDDSNKREREVRIVVAMAEVDKGQ